VPTLNADLSTSVMPGVAFDSPAAVTTWVLFAILTPTTGHPGRPFMVDAHQADRADRPPVALPLAGPR
jgi:hypothetical protein